MGPARWIFLVQMLGGEDRCSKYTLNLVVFKGKVLSGLCFHDHSLGKINSINSGILGEEHFFSLKHFWIQILKGKKGEKCIKSGVKCLKITLFVVDVGEKWI